MPLVQFQLGTPTITHEEPLLVLFFRVFLLNQDKTSPEPSLTKIASGLSMALRLSGIQSV